MIVIFALFACGIIGVNSKFPNGVERCKFGDYICIKKQLDYISQNDPNGEEDLLPVSLNPLKVKTINLKQPASSAVNIDLSLFDASLYGLKNASFEKISGFGEDVRGPHTVQFYVSNLRLLAQYKIDGKVLILPIRGVGDANLTASGLNLTFRFEGKPLEKNGKIFLNIDKMKTRLKLERFYMNLTNLFHDKALSDNMNKFLNENWEDIWNELKESITKELNDVLLGQLLKPIFSNHPYDELFLKE